MTISRYTLVSVGDADPATRILDDRIALSPGLGADRTSLPADGSAAALLHYAQGQPGDAAWSVNGQPYTEPLQQDAASGLWWSEIEVDAVGRTAGDLVAVTCNGSDPVTLEVV